MSAQRRLVSCCSIVREPRVFGLKRIVGWASDHATGWLLRSVCVLSLIERAEIQDLFAEFKRKYDALNVSLYDFALCFEAGKDKTVFCDASAGGR